MFLNLDCALTGEMVSKSMVSDIICDTDTCYILDNVYTAPAKMHLLNPSAANICWHYLHECVEANSVGPDQNQSDWVHTVCVYLN